MYTDKVVSQDRKPFFKIRPSGISRWTLVDEPGLLRHLSDRDDWTVVFLGNWTQEEALSMWHEGGLWCGHDHRRK